MSNYHGCKEEAINLIPQYLIDIFHKLVKPSHLEKLQIIQNISKLMFQVILTFSDRILIKQHSFLHPFRLGGRKQIIVCRFAKNSTWTFDWRTEAWVKMHRCISMHFLEMWISSIEKISPHMMEYTSQRKFNKHSGER